MKIQIRPDVLKLGLPILVEQAFVTLMVMVNTIMAGRISKEAFSAISLVDSLNILFVGVFTALGVGATVVVAQYTGQQNKRMANAATLQALASGIGLAVLIAVLIRLFRNPLTNLLFGSAEPLVMSYVHTYLDITLLTYPLIAMTLISTGALRGAGDSRTALIVNAAMNVLNVIFSYVFIYGVQLGPIRFDGMGVAGAAIGIGLARAGGAGIAALALLSGKGELHIRRLGRFRLDKSIQRTLFATGFPASIESLSFHGGKLINQMIMVGMGTVALAANGVAFSMVTLMNIPGSALSATATTLVGQSMGRGDTGEAENTLWYVTKLAAICLATLGLICLPFTVQIAGLYTTSQEVKVVAGELVFYNCIFVALYATTFVLPAGLKGAGDARFTMVSTIIGMWIFRIALGYFLGVTMGMGVLGIWIGMFTDWFVRSGLYVWRLANGRWKQNRVAGRSELPVPDQGEV